MSSFIAYGLYSVILVVALVGFSVVTSLLLGWISGRLQAKPRDMLAEYYAGLQASYHPPSKTFPDANYNERVGYVPLERGESIKDLL